MADRTVYLQTYGGERVVDFDSLKKGDRFRMEEPGGQPVTLGVMTAETDASPEGIMVSFINCEPAGTPTLANIWRSESDDAVD